MKIKWLGHACFLVTSATGIKIILDPYKSGDKIKYHTITESADIVTVSHGHYDHCYSETVSGNPIVLTQSGKAKGIEFRTVAAFHDDSNGGQRGKNNIFCFTIDGINVCHFGDLGHLLNDSQTAEIGKVDILFCPVGGFFTIDAAKATKLYESLKPKVLIPMHFKNEGVPDFPIAGVDEFLRGKKNVLTPGKSEVEFTPASLPSVSQIILLKPALL